TRQVNLRFLAVLAGFAGVVFLTYREEVLGTLVAPLTAWTAGVTLGLIRQAGMEATRVAAVVSHPSGFAYEIYYRCTGVLPVAFLATAILAYPGRWQRKLVGLLVGVPVLMALNLTRLVHLFYLGVHHPAVFDFAHSVLWEGLVILAILGLWLGWARWSDSVTDEATAPIAERPHQRWPRPRDAPDAPDVRLLGARDMAIDP
ncbi:MAG: exosortase H, partial [Candidatus Rokuibacteriota bacterium]